MWDDEDEPDYDDDYIEEDDDNEYGFDPKDYEDSMSNKSAYMRLLHPMMSLATGNAFILMMESPHWAVHQGRNFSFHPRFSQPCYGGELRKYESSHPGDCTQPQNSRPGDLYAPFPDGKPVAVGFPYFQFTQNKTYDHGNECWIHVGTPLLDDDTDEFFREFFTDDNPWVTGFGGKSNIDFYMHPVGDQQRIGGVVLKTCNVDPTVMVHMNWFIRSIICVTNRRINAYKLALEHGLKKHEAYAFILNNSGNTKDASQPNSYQNTMSFSVLRFYSQKPNDLTGGTLENRYDYNRTDIQDLWMSNFNEGPDVNWCSTFKEELAKLNYTSGNTSVFFKAVQNTLNRLLEEEKQNNPIMEYPFNVHMTSGKSKPDMISYNKKVAA